MIKLNNICKNYINPNCSDDKTEVLKELSLTVKEGELVAIVGESGSGKTTLLNIIGSLDNANSGEVIVNKQNLTLLDSAKLADFRLHNIGFIFQFHNLLPQYTVIENVLLPTIPLNNDSKDSLEYAEHLLELLNLTNKRQSYPAQISGGERQRVAVARALINRAKLLLADEPTGSLDEKNSNILMELLLKLNKMEKVTLITVTHSLEIANKMSRILKLTDGKLI